MKETRSKDYKQPECTVITILNEGLLNSISASLGGFEDGGSLSKEIPFYGDGSDEEKTMIFEKKHNKGEEE